jgi:FMN-dependent NADH-azoreductase
MSQKINLLHIDSSVTGANSVTRKLTERIQAFIKSKTAETTVVSRDVGTNQLPLLDPNIIGAYFTPEKDRSPEQKELLSISDQLVNEVVSADILIIGAPMYNFGISANLKAYFDLIARAGLTFAYTAEGPKGLLQNKKAIIAVATGGTPVGSPYDFVTPYIKQILAFMGITDLQFISIDQRGKIEELLKAAQTQIEQLKI